MLSVTMTSDEDHSDGDCCDCRSATAGGKKNLQCFPFVYLRFHGVKPKSPDDPTSSTHFVKVSECHVFVDEMQ